MKRCSKVLIMEMKSTVRYDFTPTRMAIMKKADGNKVGEGVMEKSEPLESGSRNVKQCRHFGKHFGSVSKY